MGELLFRGFHPCDGPDTIVVDGYKVKGEWIYGSHILIDGAHYIMPSRGHLHDITEVLTSTVGQWTGKIDKHEKKVFSGDKVYYSHENRIYSVEWNDSLLRWEGLVGWIAVPLYQFVDSCEVIGTVFDEVTP